MARKKGPSNQGAAWTTKEFAAIWRFSEDGCDG
jgi:hypothetical protein